MSTEKQRHALLPTLVGPSTEEADLPRQISAAELVSAAARMRKFMLEGLRRDRPDQALKRYQEEELDLSTAPSSPASPSGSS